MYVLSLEAMLMDLLDIDKPMQHLEDSELPSSRATYSWLTRTGADLLDKLGVDCDGDCAGMFLRLLNDAGLGHRPDISSMPRIFTKSSPTESDRVPSAPAWRNDSANFSEGLPTLRNDVPAPSSVESDRIPDAPQWRNDSGNFNEGFPTFGNDVPAPSFVEADRVPSAPQWRNDSANFNEEFPRFRNDVPAPSFVEADRVPNGPQWRNDSANFNEEFPTFRNDTPAPNFSESVIPAYGNDSPTLPGQVMESSNLPVPIWSNDVPVPIFNGSEIAPQLPTSDLPLTYVNTPEIHGRQVAQQPEETSSGQASWLTNSAIDPPQESTQSRPSWLQQESINQEQPGQFRPESQPGWVQPEYADMPQPAQTDPAPPGWSKADLAEQSNVPEGPMYMDNPSVASEPGWLPESTETHSAIHFPKLSRSESLRNLAENRLAAFHKSHPGNNMVPTDSAMPDAPLLLSDPTVANVGGGDSQTFDPNNLDEFLQQWKSMTGGSFSQFLETHLHRRNTAPQGIKKVRRPRRQTRRR